MWSEVGIKSVLICNIVIFCFFKHVIWGKWQKWQMPYVLGKTVTWSHVLQSSCIVLILNYFLEPRAYMDMRGLTLKQGQLNRLKGWHREACFTSQPQTDTTTTRSLHVCHTSSNWPLRLFMACHPSVKRAVSSRSPCHGIKVNGFLWQQKQRRWLRATTCLYHYQMWALSCLVLHGMLDFTFVILYFK